MVRKIILAIAGGLVLTTLVPACAWFAALMAEASLGGNWSLWLYVTGGYVGFLVTLGFAIFFWSFMSDYEMKKRKGRPTGAQKAPARAEDAP